MFSFTNIAFLNAKPSDSLKNNIDSIFAFTLKSDGQYPATIYLGP